MVPMSCRFSFWSSKVLGHTAYETLLTHLGQYNVGTDSIVNWLVNTWEEGLVDRPRIWTREMAESDSSHDMG